VSRLLPCLYVMNSQLALSYILFNYPLAKLYSAKSFCRIQAHFGLNQVHRTRYWLASIHVHSSTKAAQHPRFLLTFPCSSKSSPQQPRQPPGMQPASRSSMSMERLPKTWRTASRASGRHKYSGCLALAWMVRRIATALQ
jgi:hypothetical protein